MTLLGDIVARVMGRQKYLLLAGRKPAVVIDGIREISDMRHNYIYRA